MKLKDLIEKMLYREGVTVIFVCYEGGIENFDDVWKVVEKYGDTLIYKWYTYTDVITGINELNILI